MRLSSATRFNLFVFLLLGILTTYAACGGRDLRGDLTNLWDRLFGPKTARTLYKKELVKNDLATERELEIWDGAFSVAKTTPLRVNPPHRELLQFDGALPHSAQSFTLHLPPGRRLRISALNDGSAVFGELFSRQDGVASSRPLAFWGEQGLRELTYETERRNGEDLTFVLQSALAARGNCELRVTTEPVLLFPVAGKDEAAIKSFWGAPRDGGRRRHEGNDIFAPKGTDLLAVTDGEITRVSNGGLGGKTVWLNDRQRGLRYYYAHLDQQKVVRGQRVRRGDVVGTVGNTGNARTTPPHLHFGIYTGGAIDPYPFLQRADELPAVSPLPLAAEAPTSVPRRGSHYLRLTPERDGTVIRQLTNGEAVVVLGAVGRFYRVRTEVGETGYANFD